MKLRHAFRAAVGDRLAGAHVLADRWAEGVGGWDEQENEAWLFRLDERLHPLGRWRGWVRGLSAAPGVLAVAQGDFATNGVHLALDEGWSFHGIACSVGGVHVVDRALVLAWGLVGHAPVAFTLRGDGFVPIPSPGRIVSMSSADRDAVVAVGRDFAARWDGTGWSPVEPPLGQAGIDVRDDALLDREGQVLGIDRVIEAIGTTPPLF